MRLILLLGCFIFKSTLWAQKQGQAFADSLQSEIGRSTNDTARAKTLNRLANYYVNDNTDSALKYNAAGMVLVNKMKWIKGIASFRTSLGLILTNQGQLDSAQNQYILARDLYLQIKDSFNIAISYNNLGTIAKAKTDYVSAADYFTKTLQIGNLLEDNFLVGLGSENLALINLYQENYEKGLGFARTAYHAYLQNNNEEMIPNAFESMGTFFLRMHIYDSSLYYYKKALSLYQQTGNAFQTGLLNDDLAAYYAEKKDYGNAILKARDAKKIWDSTGPDYEDAINNTGTLGYYYYLLAKETKDGGTTTLAGVTMTRSALLTQAGLYLSEGIRKCISKNNRESESEFLHDLSEVDMLSGNYKDAYMHLKTYEEIKDSIYSQENKNKVASSINQLEIDKKNAELTISKLTIASAQKQKLFLISGLILVFIIGGMFYWQAVSRKKTNTTLLQLNNELDEANKIKARFFGILSHDLRSPVANLIHFLQFQKLRPGLLSEQQIATNEAKFSTSASALLKTMEDMLLWSKSQMEFFKPTVSLVHISDLFKTLKETFPDTDPVKLRFTAEDDLSVQTDKNYLLVIMQNLTANAIKALKDQRDGDIHWRAWQEKNQVYLSVTDSGPGIKNDQVKALYDESETSGARSGFGFHIIRDLSKAIGCSVSLNPDSGAGTSFILHF